MTTNDNADAMSLKIREWLCPVDDVDAHRIVRRACIQGTGCSTSKIYILLANDLGTWMFRQPIWQNWLRLERSFLWLYGISRSHKSLSIYMKPNYYSWFGEDGANVRMK